jgi:DtxR family Mn-dependent transcriptional regulator
MEDYLEAILALQSDGEVARVTDLAERLEVSKPSVSAALKTLAGGGFLEHRRYGYIRLTEEGRRAARLVKNRHKLLRTFLQDILGVDPEQAAEDACGLEHHISRQTREQLARFVEFVQTCPRTGDGWLKHFRCFCDSSSGVSAAPGCDPSCMDICVREVQERAGLTCRVEEPAVSEHASGCDGPSSKR